MPVNVVEATQVSDFDIGLLGTRYYLFGVTPPGPCTRSGCPSKWSILQKMRASQEYRDIYKLLHKRLPNLLGEVQTIHLEQFHSVFERKGHVATVNSMVDRPSWKGTHPLLIHRAAAATFTCDSTNRWA